MKSGNGQDLLRELGINPLTGEACAFSQRILCDLSSEGCDLLMQFWGLPFGTKLNENMNAYVGDKKAVASVMIHREHVPQILIFAMFLKGYRYVVQGMDMWGVTAFNDTDIERMPGLAMYRDRTAYIFERGAKLYINPKSTSTAPSVGSRNVHSFTGRVE